MSKMIQISDGAAAALDSVKVGSYSSTILKLVNGTMPSGATPGNSVMPSGATTGNSVEESEFPPMAYVSDNMFSSGDWRLVPSCAGVFGVNPDQSDDDILSDIIEVANDSMLIKMDTGNPEYPSYGVRYYGMPVPVFRRITKGEA